MSKIGIVLATYNGEKYLSQMLDSLLAQTRPADFIVAVDDGSTDNTLQQMIRLHNQDPQHWSYIDLSRNYGKEISDVFHFILLSCFCDSCHGKLWGNSPSSS